MASDRPNVRKPTLLLVHGGPGMDDSYFFPYLNPLQASFNLTSYVQKREASLKELTVELVSKLETFTNEPLTILAHSWGCMLTLEMLRDYKPAHLKKLILVSCAVDASVRDAFQQHRHLWSTIFISKPASSENEVFRNACMESAGAFFTSSNIERGLRVLENISYSKSSFEKFYEQYETEFDLKDVLSGLSVLTLNVYGDSDFRIPPSHSSLIGSLNPNIKNVAIEDAGHFSFIEQPDRFCEEVFHFILGPGPK